MSESLTGKLLVASPILVDPNFSRTVVLVCSHDERGAFGLVLNRPLTASVAQYLPEWAGRVGEPTVVFNGGPVDPSAAFALGRGAKVEASGWSTPVLPGVGVVDLEQHPDVLDRGVERIRIFSGYAGWAAGQLESEIVGEGWFVVDATPDDVFTARPERVWHEVLRRQPSALAMFAFFPDDPSVN